MESALSKSVQIFYAEEKNYDREARCCSGCASGGLRVRWERGNERTRHHDLRRTNYDSGSRHDYAYGNGRTNYDSGSGYHHDDYDHDSGSGYHHDDYDHDSGTGDHHDDYDHDSGTGHHHDDYDHDCDAGDRDGRYTICDLFPGGERSLGGDGRHLRG